MTADTLHITNGDSAAGLIKAASIDGDVLPWRDPMHHGPFPLHTNIRDASAIRAAYLAGDILDPDGINAEFVERDNTLLNAPQRRSVVLWFEHDLLDQLQLIQILDQLNQISKPENLELICIDRFEGIENFRGLGELSPEQLATLYPQRVEVTAAQLKRSSLLWKAFCDPYPRALQQMALKHDDAFPFLHRALNRHFQEFPWESDGLTRTERQLLSLLADGPMKAGALFAKNMDLEDSLYIGDWTTFSIINSLATSSPPLISNQDGGYLKWVPGDQEYSDQILNLTDNGKGVVEKSINANSVMHRDFWLIWAIFIGIIQ